MDLMAETVVITPSVKQTAPPIRMADPLVDLLALPSYNMNRPAKSRAAERTTSKKVEILRMVVFPGVSILVAARRESRKWKVAITRISDVRLAAGRRGIVRTQVGFGIGEFKKNGLGIYPLQLRTADTP
jgi:hypothetical protein